MSFLALIVFALPLLPVTHGSRVIVRRDSCSFSCPSSTPDGRSLQTIGSSDKYLFCMEGADQTRGCIYDTNDGTLKSGNIPCLQKAIQKCSARGSRRLTQAVLRRGSSDGHLTKREPAPSPGVQWKRQGSPSQYPKRLEPSPTFQKRSDLSPESTPPPRKSGSQPPTEAMQLQMSPGLGEEQADGGDSDLRSVLQLL